MKLSEDICRRIEAFAGLDLEVLGEAVLGVAARKRQRALGIRDLGDYLEKLGGSEEELKGYVEELLVPETYFFRDMGTFLYLREWVKGELRKRDRLRVLSLACASGEEAYSVVMACVEEGWDISRLEVIGVDLLSFALEKGRRGVYSRNSFRGEGVRGYMGYFDNKGNNEYKVREEIRGCVEFFEGNVLDGDFLNTLGVFDVVLARNIFIYLSENGKKKLIKNIENITNKQTMLVLGHADNIWRITEDFRLMSSPEVFVYGRDEVSSYVLDEK